MFQVHDGNLDDTDLSGVTFALYNHFPSNLTAGNWKVAIVVDEGASSAQTQAIERIVSGQEGGPFGDFGPLIGENLGTHRAPISVSDGTATIGDMTRFTFEPARGGDGMPTTVKNAMFGFAPEYRIGRASDSSNAFGLSFDASYGESAEYEFSSEPSGQHIRA